MGRYTFFGIDPFRIISCRGDRITVNTGKGGAPAHGAHKAAVQEETGDIFAYLRQVGARYHSVTVPGLPPFTAGAVGYLSYETVRMIEHLPPRVAPTSTWTMRCFMYFANVLAFDHVQHRLFLIANVLTEEGREACGPSTMRLAATWIDLESRLRRPFKLSASQPPHGPLRVRPNMPRAAVRSRWWSAPRNTFAPATFSRWCFRSAWKCRCAFPPLTFIARCAP